MSLQPTSWVDSSLLEASFQIFSKDHSQSKSMIGHVVIISSSNLIPTTIHYEQGFWGFAKTSSFGTAWKSLESQDWKQGLLLPQHGLYPLSLRHQD